MIESYVLGSES